MTSTTRNILIGLALGVVMGLFLGEKAGVLQLVAEAYLRLLQMTVLPYVTVSLIEGIGSLDGAQARRLFVRVGTLRITDQRALTVSNCGNPSSFHLLECPTEFVLKLSKVEPYWTKVQ
jgi:L-cystine uptake protein TcyP (sodium:dicarboxylate symporter family)